MTDFRQARRCTWGFKQTTWLHPSLRKSNTQSMLSFCIPLLYFLFPVARTQNTSLDLWAHLTWCKHWLAKTYTKQQSVYWWHPFWPHKFSFQETLVQFIIAHMVSCPGISSKDQEYMLVIFCLQIPLSQYLTLVLTSTSFAEKADAAQSQGLACMFFHLNCILC